MFPRTPLFCIVYLLLYISYILYLSKLYKSILNQPLPQEAAELLESIIRIEERDIVMLKKMIAMNYF